jgi:hypothetical protein
MGVLFLQCRLGAEWHAGAPPGEVHGLPPPVPGALHDAPRASPALAAALPAHTLDLGARACSPARQRHARNAPKYVFQFVPGYTVKHTDRRPSYSHRPRRRQSYRRRRHALNPLPSWDRVHKPTRAPQSVRGPAQGARGADSEGVARPNDGAERAREICSRCVHSCYYVIVSEGTRFFPTSLPHSKMAVFFCGSIQFGTYSFTDSPRRLFSVFESSVPSRHVTQCTVCAVL